MRGRAKELEFRYSTSLFHFAFISACLYFTINVVERFTLCDTLPIFVFIPFVTTLQYGCLNLILMKFSIMRAFIAFNFVLFVMSRNIYLYSI